MTTQVVKVLSISDAQKLMHKLLDAIIDAQKSGFPSFVEFDVYREGTEYIQPCFKIDPKK